ncbi:MAG TPA: Ig-like domain-containing protein [Gemmatimonadales bacterium]|nr:Ig-like domain-containing protein [Gemmatimonadales bacterium]
MLPLVALPALLLAFQQPTATATAPAPGLPPSPVKRIEVQPAGRTITAGDSVRLTLRALDESGKPVTSAVLAVKLLGGQGEGAVNDTTGWLVASSVGKFPLALIALVPGTEPFVDSTSVEFRGVPGPAVRLDVTPAAATIVPGQSLRLSAIPFSKANDRALDTVRWRSSASKVVSVDRDGIITGRAAGTAKVTASVRGVDSTIVVKVLGGQLGSLALSPAKPTLRQGDVVRFTLEAHDAAGKPVTGLTPSWSFSPGDGQLGADGQFVAYRPGPYTVTATVGRHAASANVMVGEREVRRSVTVVGRLPRTAFATSEVWIHPNGKVAYLGTHMGGDRVYAIDISNPGNPVVVDSILANTRLVNDMQTTPDGNYMVFTREGAADRKNGIVIADTHDPLHPKEISQFTDGVAGGVHSVYIYEHPQYGRYVFLTNDGTGAIDIVNLSDPAKPVRAGEWRTDRPDAARYVHDLDIVDGLLYASYWNDGLVILDIGNGKWGGRPDKPTLVSQFKYNLDSLYRDVEDVSAPGFTRGTHTAWRQRGGKYVFIADEVYLNGSIQGAKDASSSRMYGTLQVIDVSDIEHPRSVAWYTPEMGGVHNVWQAGDTLYMGAYDAGFHVFDISGELKGDLRAQQREMASLNTADMGGVVQNAAFDWGVVVNPKDGLAYVNDFNNGLWVVRVNPRRPQGPVIP